MKKFIVLPISLVLISFVNMALAAPSPQPPPVTPPAGIPGPPVCNNCHISSDINAAHNSYLQGAPTANNPDMQNCMGCHTLEMTKFKHTAAYHHHIKNAMELSDIKDSDVTRYLKAQSKK